MFRQITYTVEKMNKLRSQIIGDSWICELQ